MKKASVPFILFTSISLGLCSLLWAASFPGLFQRQAAPIPGPDPVEKADPGPASGINDLLHLAQPGSTLKNLRFKPDAGVSARDFLSGRFSSVFGFCEADRWRVTSERKDKWGARHYRLEQIRNGVPVYGMAYLLHEKGGRIVSANGSFLPCGETALQPAVPEATARETALASFPSRQFAWQAPGMESLLQRVKNNPSAGFFPTGRLVILPAHGPAGNLTSPRPENDRLAWQFEIFSLDPPDGRSVFIDATTGDLLWSLSIAPRCIQAQGEALYQTEPIDFCVSTVVGPSGAGYRLYDLTRNIRTLDNLGQAPDILIADHFNAGLFWDNPPHGVAVAAHAAMKETYDYFAAHQNWRHFDNDPGSQTWIWTNYGQDFVNAAKMPFGIVAGNGDGINWGPFVTLDIIAHEYVHGIIENSSKLLLYNESGALHEGLADIFGIVVEMLVSGNTGNWKLGEQAHIADPSTGVRRSDFPNLQKLPDTYNGVYWQDFADCSGPGCSIHHNSTVVSHWFYLLVNGETGVSENNDLYHVQGIGLAMAADLVFEVMTSYLSDDASFADFRQAVLLAANDLPGYDLGNLAQAFCAVGIGPCDLTSPDMITVYAPSGDPYFEGDTIEAAWENTGEITRVDIQFSLDNGVTWNPLITDLNNTGLYNWAAPGYNSDLCRIRVLNADDPLTFGVSDSFSIRGCNLLAYFTVNDHSPCFGQPVQAENPFVSEGVTYTWLVDSQPAFGTPQNLVINSLSGGAKHEIALVAVRGLCADTFRQEVAVRHQPSAGFIAVVNNQVISAVADYQDAQNYVWTLNGVVVEGKTSPGFSQLIENPGTYTLCLYVNDECGMGPVAPVCKAVTVAEITHCASKEDQVTQFNNTSDIADMVDYGDSLLISTSGGLVFYNKITNQFSVVNNANSPLAANHLGSIAVDANKNIYATLLKGKGFFRIDKTDFSIRNFDIFNLPGLISNNIRKLEFGPDGNLYIITENNGIRVASSSGDNLQIIKSITTLQGLPNKPITDIGFSDPNITWIGTQGGGLVKMVGDQVEDILTFPNGTVHDNWIRTLYADTTGVWFGTYSGKDSLHFWGEEGHTAYGYDLQSAPPVTITKGKNGHIYFGVSLNSYLLEFDGAEFTVYNDLGSCCYVKGAVVKIIPDDSENGIWVALKGKLVHWDGAASWNFKNTSLYPFVNNDIDYISLLGNDQILVSAEYGAASFNGVGFDTLEIGAYLPYQPAPEYLWILDFASEFVEDHLGRKWVAVNFYDAALAFLGTNPALGWTFIKYNELPFSSDINGLLHKDGKLYIGTEADGLWIWELENFTWTHFDETNSPVWSDYWQGEMVFDHQNRLWLAQKWFSYGGDRLLVYDGNAWNTVQLPATTAGVNLCFHPNGTLFASTTQNKIWKYDGADWVELFDLNVEINKFSVQIRDVQISLNGELLIGTSAPGNPVFQDDAAFGLIIADTSGTIQKTFNEYHSGMPSNHVKTIKPAADGAIWVGTDNGVGVIRPSVAEIIPKFSVASACKGVPVHFSNKTIGATAFHWIIDGAPAGNQPNLNFTFDQAKDYLITLLAENQDGCKVSLTQILKVNPGADLPGQLQNLSLCDNGTTLHAPEGMQSYTWKSGNQVIGAAPSLDITQSGAYVLEITDFCGNTASTTYQVLLTTDCVWPGDVNSDNRVDIYDWAFMGIGFGAFGAARAENTTLWLGHPAQNWNGQLSPGFNYKHFDTNGDGRVDRADFEAILLNYYRTHGVSPGDPGLVAGPYAFVPVVTVDADRTNQDTLALSVVVLAVHEAGQNLPLYGAAGQLRWDFQGVPVDHIQFSFENTTLGDPSRDLETMYRIFEADDEIHFALTRLDHKNQPAVSVIGEANFLVVDDVVGLGDTLAFSFSVEGPQGLVNTGHFIPLGGSTRNFQFTSGAITGESPVRPPAREPVFITYPNPVSQDLNLLYELDAVREVTFSLITAQGTEVWRETVRTGQHFPTVIPMSGLPAGVYFLEARTTAGSTIRKVIKV